MKANNESAKPLKVLVVEDSTELQKLLSEMLSEIPSVEVVASVDSEEDALKAIQTQGTDLAIVDLELGSGTGLGLLKGLFENVAANHKLLEVVVFSNYSNLIIQHRCISLGAKAFFDKSFQIDELLEYVKGQASGKARSLNM